ncbi:MAG: FkbM family methyltransferase [Lachnospiraceae bacterium]|nr:FkbM family methyltransferase [Lachnospiraceae bacterium]
MRTFQDLKRHDCAILYGAGKQFECVRPFISSFMKNIIVVDNDRKKQGTKTLFGDIIYNPDDVLSDMKRDTVIIISSIYNQYEIAKGGILDRFDINLDKIYMYTSQLYEQRVYREDLMKEHYEEVIKNADLLADDESREYYLSSYRARMERQPLLLKPNHNMSSIGEYNDIVKLLENDIIVDCGGYTGDTVNIYMNRLKEQCKIYTFEPFLDNYNILESMIRSKGWKNVFAYNYAVGKDNYEYEATYDADDYEMGFNLHKTSGKKTQRVSVRKLDDLLHDVNKIDYIKMDIEGEERNALYGAKDIIRKHHPKLMISGYHKIEDFWELPYTIRDIDSSYRIYVGHAPNVSTELEYYCI